MKITILGCGVFGTALATAFLDQNTTVWMWSKFEDEAKSTHEKYSKLNTTTKMNTAIDNTDLIVIAIPVAFLKETLETLKKFYQNQDILIASKGIDMDSLQFAFQITQKILPTAPLGVISGGSFAIDMINQNIMGLTLGTNSSSIQEKIKKTLDQKYLQIQYTNDIIGISICGAIKNVMAIGFGIIDGLKLPESSKFLYLTNAIYEITTLITNLNGNPSTIMTYAGIDDIMMTCTSEKSRNYTLGKMIGENQTKEKIEQYKETTTIEGLGTCYAIHNLLKEKKMPLPITNTIYKILYQNQSPNELINILKEKNPNLINFSN